MKTQRHEALCRCRSLKHEVGSNPSFAILECSIEALGLVGFHRIRIVVALALHSGSGGGLAFAGLLDALSAGRESFAGDGLVDLTTGAFSCIELLFSLIRWLIFALD